MRNIIIIVLLLFLMSSAVAEQHGDTAQSQLTIFQSQYDFTDTIDKLRTAIASKGLTIFAVIDHTQAAASVGLEMPNTKVIIFGNPKVGTPLMLAAPELAIQLPLRVLIQQDGDTVKVSILKAQYLAESVGQPAALTEKLNKVSGLIKATVSK